VLQIYDDLPMRMRSPWVRMARLPCLMHPAPCDISLTKCITFIPRFHAPNLLVVVLYLGFELLVEFLIWPTFVVIEQHATFGPVSVKFHTMTVRVGPEYYNNPAVRIRIFSEAWMAIRSALRGDVDLGVLRIVTIGLVDSPCVV
jgi:hypothetical protein